jgi:hypothetical protein
LERQALLARRDSHSIFYIHEHVLRLVVGSPAVMYEQMVALTLASALPNVDVYIVPASAGERSAVGEAFRLLEFDSQKPLVHIDLAATTLWFEQSTHVDSYRGLIPTLAGIAEGADQSQSSFAELADSYDRTRIRQAAAQLDGE